MKIIRPELQQKLDQGNSSLILCVRIETLSGVHYGLTTHVQNLELDGLTYYAEIGLNPTQIQSSNTAAVDSVDFTSAFSILGITQTDILSGQLDAARVFVFLTDYSDPQVDDIPLLAGTWGQVRFDRQGFTTEFRALSQHLQQQVGCLMQPQCDAQLGDTRCGVDIEAFTFTGTVTAVTNAQTLTVSNLNSSSGYFNGGPLNWQTGSNTRLVQEVLDWDLENQTLVLVEPPPFTISIHDTFHVIAGCQRTLSDCQNKFNNVVRFRGFPHLPGRGRALRFGGQG